MEFVDKRVEFIFDEMWSDYDDIKDLWYSWLFSRLHFLIAKEIINRWDDTARSVLDIGCGTGFQSFLYARAGATVTGVDISTKLIEVARKKSAIFLEKEALFKPHFPFVNNYNEKINNLLARFPKNRAVSPVFDVQNVLNLNFQDNYFDHVNCCGSVLSFVANHKAALSEIFRVLKIGGSFIFEVEGKYNIDTMWTIFDSLTGGHLGYDSNVSEALEPFKFPLLGEIAVEYPFGEAKNPTYMPIKLFTKRGLGKELNNCGLSPEYWWAIHSLTNLLPSTFLDSPTSSKIATHLFRVLSYAEERLPFYVPGCSIVVSGFKLGEL